MTSSNLGFVGGPGEGGKDARGDSRIHRGSAEVSGAKEDLGEEDRGWRRIASSPSTF